MNNKYRKSYPNSKIIMNYKNIDLIQFFQKINNKNITIVCYN